MDEGRDMIPSTGSEQSTVVDFLQVKSLKSRRGKTWDAEKGWQLGLRIRA